MNKQKKMYLLSGLSILIALLASHFFWISNVPKEDGEWWACHVEIDNQWCIKAPVIVFGLNNQEKSFINSKLDKLPPPPKDISKQEIEMIFNEKPSQESGIQTYYLDYGPGIDKNRGVIVSLWKGKLMKVFWHRPAKLTLIKSYRTSS